MPCVPIVPAAPGRERYPQGETVKKGRETGPFYCCIVRSITGAPAGSSVS